MTVSSLSDSNPSLVLFKQAPQALEGFEKTRNTHTGKVKPSRPVLLSLWAPAATYWTDVSCNFSLQLGDHYKDYPLPPSLSPSPPTPLPGGVSQNLGVGVERLSGMSKSLDSISSTKPKQQYWAFAVLNIFFFNFIYCETGVVHSLHK